jgi:hypothetical protein
VKSFYVFDAKWKPLVFCSNYQNLVLIVGQCKRFFEDTRPM